MVLTLLPFTAVIFSLLFRGNFSSYRELVVLYQLSTNSISIIILSAIILSTPKRLERFLAILWILSFFLCLNVLLTNQNLQWNINHNVFRLYNETGEILTPIQFGRLAGLLILLGMYFFIFSRKIPFKLFAFLTIILGLISVIYANERGPLLSAIICFSIYSFIYLINDFQHPKQIIGIILISLCLLYVFNASLEHVSQFGSRYDLNSMIPDFYESRISRWVASLNIWLDHPLFGVGVRGIPAINPMIHYPHNVIIDFLVSGGFVAIILWVPAILQVRNNIVKHVTDRKFFFIKILTLFGLINAMVSADIIHNNLLYMGIVLLQIYNKESVQAPLYLYA
jgi:O-antigen ligase